MSATLFTKELPEVVQLALFLCLLAVTLHGCAEEGSCPLDIRRNPPEVPFEPDLERLDRLAGCNNNWNFLHGKPCASDVPILFAKKGLQIDVDGDWVKQNLENQDSYCLTFMPSSSSDAVCSSWYSQIRGCWRDELAICNCTPAPSGTWMISGGKCTTWRCYTKVVPHHACWEANWDTSFNTVCDAFGNNALILDYFQYVSWLHQISKHTIGSADFEKRFISAGKEKSTFNSRHGKECTVPEPVGTDKQRMPACDHWRTVVSKVWNCGCTDERCHGWTCETVPDAPWKHFIEKQTYKCTHFESSSCMSWSGEIDGYPLVGQVECRSCASSDYTCRFDDQLAACTQYVLQHIVEIDRGDAEDGSWGKRLGFTIAHLLWIGPSFAVMALWLARGIDGCREGRGDFEDWKPKCFAVWFAVNCLVTGIVVVTIPVLIWVLAFVRDKRDTNVPDADEANAAMPRYEKGVAPLGPWWGVFLTALLSSLLAVGFSIAHSDSITHDYKRWLLAACSSLLMVFTISLMYTSGTLVCLLTLIPLCVVCYKVARGLKEGGYFEMSTWRQWWPLQREDGQDSMPVWKITIEPTATKSIEEGNVKTHDLDQVIGKSTSPRIRDSKVSLSLVELEEQAPARDSRTTGGISREVSPEEVSSERRSTSAPDVSPKPQDIATSSPSESPLVLQDLDSPGGIRPARSTKTVKHRKSTSSMTARRTTEHDHSRKTPAAKAKGKGKAKARPKAQGRSSTDAMRQSDRERPPESHDIEDSDDDDEDDTYQLLREESATKIQRAWKASGQLQAENRKTEGGGRKGH